VRIEEYQAARRELVFSKWFNRFFALLAAMLLIFLIMATLHTFKEVKDLKASRVRIEQRLQEIGHGIEVEPEVRK